MGPIIFSSVEEVETFFWFADDGAKPSHDLVLRRTANESANELNFIFYYLFADKMRS